MPERKAPTTRLQLEHIRNAGWGVARSRRTMLPRIEALLRSVGTCKIESQMAADCVALVLDELNWRDSEAARLASEVEGML